MADSLTRIVGLGIFAVRIEIFVVRLGGFVVFISAHVRGSEIGRPQLEKTAFSLDGLAEELLRFEADELLWRDALIVVVSSV